MTNAKNICICIRPLEPANARNTFEHSDICGVRSRKKLRHASNDYKCSDSVILLLATAVELRVGFMYDNGRWNAALCRMQTAPGWKRWSWQSGNKWFG